MTEETFRPAVAFDGLNPVIGFRILRDIDDFFMTEQGQAMLQRATDILSEVFYDLLIKINPLKDPYAILDCQQKGRAALGAIEFMNDFRNEAINSIQGGEQEQFYVDQPEDESEEG